MGLVRLRDGQDIDRVGAVFVVRRRNTDSCIGCIYKYCAFKDLRRLLRVVRL